MLFEKGSLYGFLFLCIEARFKLSSSALYTIKRLFTIEFKLIPFLPGNGMCTYQQIRLFKRGLKYLKELDVNVC
jgi:hypothetical protein